MKLLLNLVVGTVAVLVATYILPGVEVESILTAVVVAVVLGVINAFIKPILTLLTLPLTLMTLGLFSLVLNALLVLLVTYIVPGFTVDNFWWALLFSIVISIVSAFLSMLLKD